jgi:flagellar motor switch protein FliG
MPEEFRGDIVIRMANLDPVSPEVLQDMEEVLESEIKSIGSLSSEQVGGIDNVAELFNQMDKSSMTEILSEVEEEEPELADSIRALMFVFDDSYVDRSLLVDLNDLADVTFEKDTDLEEVKKTPIDSLS